ncbi:hypothetical protein IW261DRAFT_1623907 [Armillaria novae-zelandiae]|uniref:Uncharacterized protein n=1 Tax=Armillaria novae-zelandiae TaxID=153914 RepID=A0AA39UIM1_9AGAR|nr:hypothetical protein IW261DRAFT_1623907 [Armillaria novae-zelandiae]
MSHPLPPFENPSFDRLPLPHTPLRELEPSSAVSVTAARCVWTGSVLKILCSDRGEPPPRHQTPPSLSVVTTAVPTVAVLNNAYGTPCQCCGPVPHWDLAPDTGMETSKHRTGTAFWEGNIEPFVTVEETQYHCAKEAWNRPFKCTFQDGAILPFYSLPYPPFWICQLTTGAYTIVFAACASHDDLNIFEGIYIYAPNAAVVQKPIVLDEDMHRKLREFTEVLLRDVGVQ